MTALPSYIDAAWPLAEQLCELADRAIPEDQWGEPQQVEAENAFFELLATAYPDHFGEESEFAGWALKATTPEMLVEAMRRAAPLIGSTAEHDFLMWRMRQD